MISLAGVRACHLAKKPRGPPDDSKQRQTSHRVPGVSCLEPDMCMSLMKTVGDSSWSRRIGMHGSPSPWLWRPASSRLHPCN